MMLQLIKKYFIKHPKIQDIICYLTIKTLKKKSGVLGSVFFKIKAKLYGVQCSGKVTCYGKCDLTKAPFSRIIIGNNVVFISDSYRATASSIFAPVKIQTFSKTSCIEVGDNVGLNGTSIVARSKMIRIGFGTMIAPNVTIMDSDFHALWPPEDRAHNPANERDKDVIIGSNVWIGARSVILKGSIIGENSIIGAGSVVNSEIPKNVIAAGVPAKVIKTLK